MLLLAGTFTHAQELFVYADPASNMPARSGGFRLTNWLMNETSTNRINFHTIPELMIGVNNKLMIHAEAFLSNRDGGFVAEGGGLYAKYRFLTADKMYRHFRMAAYARASYNNSTVHQQEIATFGHNGGYQLGLIATQLLHKTALSVTGYYEKAVNQTVDAEYTKGLTTHAANYILSAGRLILPRHYTGYKQTNVNLMVEVLGQVQPENGNSYVDVAPSVQFIFNSQTRVDIAYRREIYSGMYRTAPNGFLLRVEHLLFNVL